MEAHTIERIDDETMLLYVDFHIMNEYTSPQAFAGLHSANRPVWRPEAHLVVVDHVNPTRAISSLDDMKDTDARLQIENLGRNCVRHKIELFDLFDPRQGIERVVVPENGYALPRMVIACGDSHTTTYGALGALSFGIGTSEIEHVLATRTLAYRVLKPMRVRFCGTLPEGVTCKDLVMAFIAKAGVSGAVGHAVEFQGEAISALDVEARMTICNMAVTGANRSIRPNANGALGASCTSVLILSAGRSFARTSPRTMSAIRPRCQVFWIQSTVRLIGSLQMEHTTENQHLICLPRGSHRRSRSLSRAPMRLMIRRHETAISPRSKATGGWRGSKPLATTNAAGAKPLWAARKSSLDPS